MKSYIIRLQDHEFSSCMAQQCVDQAQKFGLTINLFDAVTGDQAQKIFDQDGIHKYPHKLKRNTAGVQGCAGSHYLLWKQCAADQVPYLVLEHDGYMIRPLPNVLEKFDHVLKLDPMDPFSKSYDQDTVEDHGTEIRPYDVGWGYKKKAAPYGGYFKGAWSYIIKPQAAERLIQAVRDNGWVPADKQFGQNLLELKTTVSTIFRIHPTYTSANIEQLSLTRNL
jgi:GR25 family glycosyltransferase involved in LPS biosynthesis